MRGTAHGIRIRMTCLSKTAQRMLRNASINEGTQQGQVFNYDYTGDNKDWRTASIELQELLNLVVIKDGSVDRLTGRPYNKIFISKEQADSILKKIDQDEYFDNLLRDYSPEDLRKMIDRIAKMLEDNDEG
jgi:hypothetical protein